MIVRIDDGRLPLRHVPIRTKTRAMVPQMRDDGCALPHTGSGAYNALMKLAFLGTSDFAVPALQALVDAGHEVVAVYTRAPKPAGRGQKEQKTPVHRLAGPLGLVVRTPRTLRTDEAAAERYRVEPYVVAADVYSGPDKGGRGGWTWYTGSAGWLYRAAVEAVLGIRRKGDEIIVDPAMPGDWGGYTATLAVADKSYRIAVSRDPGTGKVTIEVDGGKLKGNAFRVGRGRTNVIRLRDTGS